MTASPGLSSKLVARYSADQFTLQATLDKDVYGTTMLARDNISKKLYAIKVLKKDFMNGERDTNFLKIFSPSNIDSKQQPFLQTFHGFFETNTCIHLVLEFVQGGTLMHHLQRGKFEFSRAKLYGAQICLALKSLHEHGVVHRNLNLDNVLLAADGHVKVAGYENLKDGMWYGSTTSTFCGSCEFMPPEVLLGVGYGRAVDWWAFGIVLHQMILCQSPFVGGDEDEIYDAILGREPVYPVELGQDCFSILQGLLTRKPELRLGSSERDALDIMDHPFFSGLDWDEIYHKQFSPSFKPVLKDGNDLSNFELNSADQAFVIKPCNDW